jgi:hypothetical protein
MPMDPKTLKMIIVAIGVGLIIFASKYFGAI